MTSLQGFLINFLLYDIWSLWVHSTSTTLMLSKTLSDWIQKVCSHNLLQIKPSILTIWDSQQGNCYQAWQRRSVTIHVGNLWFKHVYSPVEKALLWPVRVNILLSTSTAAATVNRSGGVIVFASCSLLHQACNLSLNFNNSINGKCWQCRADVHYCGDYMTFLRWLYLVHLYWPFCKTQTDSVILVSKIPGPLISLD